MPPNSRTNCEQNSAPTPHTHNTRTHADTTTHPRHPHTNTDTSDSVLQTMQTKRDATHYKCQKLATKRSVQEKRRHRDTTFEKNTPVSTKQQTLPRHWKCFENLQSKRTEKKHQVLGEATKLGHTCQFSEWNSHTHLSNPKE